MRAFPRRAGGRTGYWSGVDYIALKVSATSMLPPLASTGQPLASPTAASRCRRPRSGCSRSMGLSHLRPKLVRRPATSWPARRDCHRRRVRVRGSGTRLPRPPSPCLRFLTFGHAAPVVVEQIFRHVVPPWSGQWLFAPMARMTVGSRRVSRSARSDGLSVSSMARRSASAASSSLPKRRSSSARVAQ